MSITLNFIKLYRLVYPNLSQSVNKCNFSLRSRFNHVNHKKDTIATHNLMEFIGEWPEKEQHNFVQHMRVIVDFITEEEEIQILKEIEPYMQRLHYESSHWDDAIHGFRETERKKWYPHNRQVLERVRQEAFEGEIIPFVHILDLKEDGVIKPHVDSTRHCGNTIAGVSLLTDCVMRLVRVDETKYRQPPLGVLEEPAASCESPEHDDYRYQPKASVENAFYANILLPRRSLYIMSNSSRYNFTHEVLANEDSKFRGQPIKKTRRISIICRNEPQ